MPNYVKSTLAAELTALGKMHSALRHLDQALADEKISQDLAGRLRGSGSRSYRR